jgi:DNA-binding XRE family transcriptional regulator
MRGPLRQTYIRYDGHPVTIEFRLHARLPAKARRALMVSLFREVRPWLEMFTGSMMAQSDRWTSFERPVHHPILESATRSQGALGLRIRMLRLERGLTLAQLSEKAGLNLGHLSELERGLLKPRPATLLKLERALGAES